MGEDKKHKKKDKKHKKDKHKKKKEDKKHKKHKKDKKEKKEKRIRDSSSSSSDDSRGSSPSPARPGGAPPASAAAEIGPAMPPPGALKPFSDQDSADTANPSIGPALPPGVILPSSGADDDADEEDIGPSMPEPAASEAAAAQRDEPGVDSQEKPRKSGPMMPALPEGVDLEKLAYETAKVDWQRVAQEEEEEEEDLVGPVMEGQISKGYMEATIAAGRKAISNAKARAEEAEAAKKPKHEDWMTSLPTVGPFTQTVDEMGKNRTFSRKEKEGRGDTSEWTDTPADKERKARERAMGIKSGQKRSQPEGPSLGQVVDQHSASLVSEYNAALRPKSLVEMHQEEMRKKQKPGEAKGSVAPGGWDRAELSQPRMKDKKQVDQLFASAQGLSGRFSGNSFHGV